MTLTKMASMVDKKKAPTKTSFKPGSIPGNAVLTAQNALDIRQLHAAGFPLNQLAMVYGVSYQHVWNIVKNRKWQNAMRQV